MYYTDCVNFMNSSVIVMKQIYKLVSISLLVISAGCSDDDVQAGPDKRKQASPFKAQTDALQEAKQVEQLLQDAAKRRQQKIEEQLKDE